MGEKGSTGILSLRGLFIGGNVMDIDLRDINPDPRTGIMTREEYDERRKALAKKLLP